MKRRSLLNGGIAITLIVLGVTLINITIKAICYLFLAMFKYPVETLLVMVALTGLIILADTLFKRVKNK